MDHNRVMSTRSAAIEWPTVALIAACTLTWMAATWFAGREDFWPALAVAALCVTLHSSLQHEVLHGHPTRNRRINEALVFIAPGLFIPYRRFMVLHLKHHNDPNLTDPYEDPETNFLAKADWDRLPVLLQLVREANNTLAGRLILGPAIAVTGFVLADLNLLLAGDRRVWKAWALHLLGLLPVLAWVQGVCGLNPWTYLWTVAYPAFSLLTVRTFLEHRAEQAVPMRTCIVEDPSGFWALLFLNNNLHLVHHLDPKAAWYRMPSLYARDKARYLDLNGGYRFGSYWAVIGRYAFRSKAPLPHPFLRQGQP